MQMVLPNPINLQRGIQNVDKTIFKVQHNALMPRVVVNEILVLNRDLLDL